ncbi:MAG TPA: phosphoribosyltransferase family protein [Actinomycetota bacterium]|nr:phosphoribosyltransferase family protein [Actinomycetota bacterium]
MNAPLFRDRTEAGRALARSLEHYAARDPIVLALPRGGVPVAVEVARALRVPVHLLVVRKLGVPGHEELAFGAVASGGLRVIDEEVVARTGVRRQDVEEITQREAREVERRRIRYGASPPALSDRSVIIVDDGLATGSTMRAAARAVRGARPRHTAIAVPVAAPDVCDAMRSEADAVVCVETPQDFAAVGLWYEDFGQVGDEDVHRYLTASGSHRG